jgi:hypothetical protein
LGAKVGVTLYMLVTFYIFITLATQCQYFFFGVC